MWRHEELRLLVPLENTIDGALGRFGSHGSYYVDSLERVFAPSTALGSFTDDCKRLDIDANALRQYLRLLLTGKGDPSISARTILEQFCTREIIT